MNKDNSNLDALKKALDQNRGDDVHSRARRGEIYRNLAWSYMNIKNAKEAESAANNAVAIFEKLVDVDQKFKAGLVDSLKKLGEIYFHLKSDTKSAISYYDRALLVSNSRIKNSNEVLTSIQHADVLQSYGTSVAARNPIKSLELIEESVRLYRTIQQNLDSSGLKSYGIALNNLAILKKNNLESKNAIALNYEALRIRQQLYELNGSDALEDLGFTLGNLGLALSVDEHPGAERVLLEAISIRKRIISTSPESYSEQLHDSLCNLALHRLKTNNIASSMALFQEACEVLEKFKDCTSRCRKKYDEAKLYVSQISEELNSRDE
jgi:tetratricopeptide (TPR) repeat protein